MHNIWLYLGRKSGSHPFSGVRTPHGKCPFKFRQLVNLNCAIDDKHVTILAHDTISDD